MFVLRKLPGVRSPQAQFTHAGSGTLNVNSGSGNLNAHSISGGDHPQMFNADTIYYESAGKPEDKAATCRSALLLTDPSIDRKNLIYTKGPRVEGTCEWVLADDAYRSWSTGEDRLLWIHGSPGRGKTMISIFLTETLEKDHHTVYYFCSSEDEKRRNASNVMRGLLWQMTAIKPELTRLMFRYMDIPARTKDAFGAPELLWDIFLTMLQEMDSSPIYYVLDGLDECTDKAQQWLIDKFTKLVETDTCDACNFSLVIISRDIAALRNCRQIKLDPDNDEHISDDIKVFVKAKVNQLSKRVEIDDDFRSEVEDTLLRRAEGTFLWVGFAIEELLQKQSQDDVKAALCLLPRGLNPIYNRILLRIDAAHRSMSCRLLPWITLAVQPLRIGELATALEPHSPTRRHLVERVERCVRSCAPFLRIHEGRVSLVHESARTFLLDGELHADLAGFRITPEESHLVLAEACLEILSRSPSIRDFTRARHYDFSVSSSPDSMLDYAILNWPTHARLSLERAPRLLRSRSFLSAQRSLVLQSWWNAYLRLQPRQKIPLLRSERGSRPPRPSLLQLACGFGILAWVEELLERETGLPAAAAASCPLRRRPSNRRDRGGWTPLMSAVRGGHADVVKLLLDHGVDVDRGARTGESALVLAILYDFRDIFEELIRRGASVAGGEIPPVVYAAAYGDCNMVRLLLDRGADVNAMTPLGETALTVAVRGQDPGVVRLLLRRGGDSRARDANGKTALDYAYQRQKGSTDSLEMSHREEIVEMLRRAG